MFNPRLENAEASVAAIAPTVLEKKCPDCGSSLLQRRGRYGVFNGCSNFPKCKYIENEDGTKNPEPEKSGKMCPLCGKELIIRKRKRDGKEFLACPGFPKCKHAENMEE